MTLPSPSALLGINDVRFESWYPGQFETFSRIMDWYHSPTRFLGVAAATGTGKTLLALLLARLSEARTVIITATKGLQSQYMRDCSQLGGVVVMGQGNFPCPLSPPLTADEGSCHDGLPCPHPQSGSCPYREQLKAALGSQIVVTNYAYWLAQTNFSSGLGDVGLLVLDEAHTAGAFGAMENYLTIFLSRLDIEPMGIFFPKPAPVQEGASITSQWPMWKTWADVSRPIVQDQVARIEADVKSLRSLSKLVPSHVSRAYRTAKSVLARLDRLALCGEDWVIQQTYHGFRFVPKWVSNYAGHLFHDVPKVMLMSAILSPKTCDYLGVPANGSRAWVDAPSYFPPENTPIWHIPTARINYRTDDYGSTLWVSRIDQIIQRRLDRKGIVFTVSYERARMLLSRSRFKHIMFAHSTADVVQVVERFKRSPSPAVLVSPSVTTGYDFPGLGEPQYLVVGKVPYPDTKDDVTQARHEDDKDWSSYLAMETLIQESGRTTRSAEDRSEVLVIDDNFKWFVYRYRDLMPSWFRARVRGSLESVPDPLV